MVNRSAYSVNRQLHELSLLFDISETLNKSYDIKEVLEPVLKVMAEHMGMFRGTLTILNRDTNEIFIESAYGLSVKEQARGKYKVGEGITGKVVESGKAMVIEKISAEPQFLDRTKARNNNDKHDISFICVPIKIGSEVIGALSVDRLFSEDVSPCEDLRLLTIIASLIARSVQLHQNIYEDKKRLSDENKRLQLALKEKFCPSNMIGNSNLMQEVYEMISRVSPSEATVFIHGESGVGKELVASAIHYNSARSNKPFIKVNCAAFPDNLIESELFGHEKGAFTGATERRKGRFERAHGGTLFLDEVGDLSLMTQVKLLRVLQEREFERVGGSENIKVDVRIIAATNKPMEKLIENGEFRQDLYYRLNVFPVYVPPLRERKSDIILLADYFVEKYNTKSQKQIKRITTAAIDMLISYHWPGNVRELENTIERAILLSLDGVIHAYHLPPSLQTGKESGTVPQGKLNVLLSNVEKDAMIDALKATNGNMAKAAKVLGITERVMGLRMIKHNVQAQRFKQ